MFHTASEGGTRRRDGSISAAGPVEISGGKIWPGRRNGSDFLRFSFHEFSEECAYGVQHNIISRGRRFRRCSADHRVFQWLFLCGANAERSSEPASAGNLERANRELGSYAGGQITAEKVAEKQINAERIAEKTRAAEASRAAERKRIEARKLVERQRKQREIQEAATAVKRMLRDREVQQVADTDGPEIDSLRFGFFGQ